MNEAELAFATEADKAVDKFNAAMDDDLNTADAIGAMFELVREVFKLPQSGVSRDAVLLGQAKMQAMADVLGLFMKQADGLPADIQAMADARAAARKAKDWKKSDELRDAIHAAGYILEDTAAGQKVRISV